MKSIRFFILISFSFTFQINVSAQNRDINMLHDINQISATKDYSYAVSQTTSAVCFAVPAVMLGAGLVKNDDELFKNGLYVGASLAIQGVMSYSLKEVFKRPRPYISYPDRVEPYTTTLNYSFPSGHTMAAFDLATAMTLKYPKWYIIVPSYFWAVSVGYSRMNLGVHYPTDVMAGAVFGAGSAYVTYLINECFWKKNDNKRIIPETW